MPSAGSSSEFTRGPILLDVGVGVGVGAGAGVEGGAGMGAVLLLPLSRLHPADASINASMITATWEVFSKNSLFSIHYSG